MRSEESKNNGVEWVHHISKDWDKLVGVEGVTGVEHLGSYKMLGVKSLLKISQIIDYGNHWFHTMQRSATQPMLTLASQVLYGFWVWLNPNLMRK